MTITYKSILKEAINRPDNVVENIIKKEEEKEEISCKDLVLWESYWYTYLNYLFNKFISSKYEDNYAEFVEIAYLMTPWSNHAKRVVFPRDKYICNDHVITNIRPIDLIQMETIDHDLPLFRNTSLEILIETDFSMYLFNINPEEEEKDSSESEEEEEYYSNSE